MIKIKENDYVQPSEVREDVVQMICTSLVIHYADTRDGEGRGIHLEGAYPKLTIGVHGFKTPRLLETGHLEYKENIAVRTCEMESAFEIIQDAGYYIYEYCKQYGEMVYHISKKPFFENKKAERVHFTIFID